MTRTRFFAVVVIVACGSLFFSERVWAQKAEPSVSDTSDGASSPADTTTREAARFDSTGGTPWYEGAWNEITTRRGARLTYIFYREADTKHDGVVIRVENTNNVPIIYDATVVFRSASGQVVTAEARGAVPAQGMKTGDADGRESLFWIPFKDTDETIDQVGVRGLKIWHVPPERLEEVKRKFGIEG